MSASGALRQTLLRSIFLRAHAAGKFAAQRRVAVLQKPKRAAVELARCHRARGLEKNILVFRTEIFNKMTIECVTLTAKCERL